MTETFESAQGDASRSAVVSHTRVRWRSILWDVGTLSFVAAFLVGVIVGFVPMDADEALGWVTLVIGDWIPTWSTVQISLAGIGAASLIGAVFVAPSSPPQHGFVHRLTFTAVLTVAVLVSMLAVELGSSRYSVLSEQSDGGCRVVVREYSFLLAGRGTVGIVQPGSVTAQWLGRYGSDDGFMPFSAGSYKLEWSGKTADLKISGEASNWAAWSGDKPTITCVR